MSHAGPGRLTLVFHVAARPYSTWLWCCEGARGARRWRRCSQRAPRSYAPTPAGVSWESSSPPPVLCLPGRMQMQSSPLPQCSFASKGVKGKMKQNCSADVEENTAYNAYVHACSCTRSMTSVVWGKSPNHVKHWKRAMAQAHVAQVKIGLDCEHTFLDLSCGHFIQHVFQDDVIEQSA